MCWIRFWNKKEWGEGGGRGGSGGKGGRVGVNAKKRKASNIQHFNSKQIKQEFDAALNKWPGLHCERVDPAFQIRKQSLDLFLDSIHVQMNEINVVFQKKLKELCKHYRKSHDTIIIQNIAKCGQENS